MEALRFFLVALAGLVVDIAVAWCVVRLFGAPLWLAASLGFSVAAAVNYVTHELWTFRSGRQRLYAWRALRYAMALAATLAARIGAVALLAAFFGGRHALAILLAGAAVSFYVNYLISKHLVFKTRLQPEEFAR